MNCHTSPSFIRLRTTISTVILYNFIPLTSKRTVASAGFYSYVSTAIGTTDQSSSNAEQSKTWKSTRWLAEKEGNRNLSTGRVGLNKNPFSQVRALIIEEFLISNSCAIFVVFKLQFRLCKVVATLARFVATILLGFKHNYLKRDSNLHDFSENTQWHRVEITLKPQLVYTGDWTLQPCVRKIAIMHYNTCIRLICFSSGCFFADFREAFVWCSFLDPRERVLGSRMCVALQKCELWRKWHHLLL